MKALFIALSVFLICGCSDHVEETYATFDEAVSAGASDRGWIPSFVLKSAKSITDAHNLDTNEQELEFLVDPADVSNMVLGMRPISIDSFAKALTRELRLEGSHEAFVVCGRPLNGALLVEQDTGRAFYTTYVDWATKDCSQAG
ncbi:MAG: hypothetical protein EOO38_21325 [Cytophagaceae bacterium]|nr:MAG: hypothetical protein EOO38_21325 [Cytophagaceae bacterium]